MKYLGTKKLETERLILRKTEEKDLKELWNILLIPEVSKYYLTSKINEDWEKEKVWQYKKLEESSNKDIFRWTIELKDNNEVIGQIDVPKTDNDDIRDIGWFIDPSYQRKGYTYEAAIEILKYMFLEVEISKIETSACIKNPASYLLMEKLGFKTNNTTKKVKYTLLEEKQICKNYTLTKKDFLKELFRKESLYIEKDIDKDPYIKHISDDQIINLTGLSGSGKTTTTSIYKDDENCIVIDTDDLRKNKKETKNLYNYIKGKYKEIPDICNDFDKIYISILEYYKDSNKTIIIDSALYNCMKDITLLKGDLIIVRTSINNCFNRCIERYKKNNPNYTFEELTEYEVRKKNIFKLSYTMNSFIDKVDRL